jgi:hypothetical protein
MPRKPREFKTGKQRSRVNGPEPVANSVWTKPYNKFNTFCWLSQEDVPEPGHECPMYLRAEGYQDVRDTETCVDYFRGRFLAAADGGLEPDEPQRPEGLQAA